MSIPTSTEILLLYLTDISIRRVLLIVKLLEGGTPIRIDDISDNLLISYINYTMIDLEDKWASHIYTVSIDTLTDEGEQIFKRLQSL